MPVTANGDETVGKGAGKEDDSTLGVAMLGPEAGRLGGRGGLESCPGKACSWEVAGKVDSKLSNAGSSEVSSLNTLYLSLAGGDVTVPKAPKLSASLLAGNVATLSNGLLAG